MKRLEQHLYNTLEILTELINEDHPMVNDLRYLKVQTLVFLDKYNKYQQSNF